MIVTFTAEHNNRANMHAIHTDIWIALRQVERDRLDLKHMFDSTNVRRAAFAHEYEIRQIDVPYFLGNAGRMSAFHVTKNMGDDANYGFTPFEEAAMAAIAANRGLMVAIQDDGQFIRSREANPGLRL